MNRLLFLTTNDISDPVRGCDRRSARLREHLADHYRVHALSYRKRRGHSTGSEIDRHRSYPYPFSSLVAPFNIRLVFAIVAEFRAREYDVVVASALGSIWYGLLARGLFGAELVLDLHNVDDELSSEIGDYPRYFFAKLFLSIGFRCADTIVVTSDTDRSSLPTEYQEKTIVVANGFDSDTFHPSQGDGGPDCTTRILFFGNLSYAPNIEAVEEISKTIAPALSTRLPEYDIHIAGPDAETIEPIVEDRENVTVVGLIDDIAGYIRNSELVIVPLSTGSGTRLKIIESLACGTLVVSTPKGAEGWPRRWQNVIVADIPRFPAEIERTIESRTFDASELPEIRRYSWEQQVETLIDRLGNTRDDPTTIRGDDIDGSSAGGPPTDE